MDRRKAEAHSQLQKLKEECEITMELLKTLIDVSSKHVNEIEKLEPRDFRLYSKYFLAVSQFQHLTSQKLLEVNVDLEEHICERNPPSLEHFKLVNGRATPIFNCKESESSLNSPTLTLIEPPVFKPYEVIQSEKPPQDLLQLNVKAGRHTPNTDGNNCTSSNLFHAANTATFLPPVATEIINKTENLLLEKSTVKYPSTSTLLNCNGIIKNSNDFDDETTSSEYYYCSSNQNDSASQIDTEITNNKHLETQIKNSVPLPENNNVQNKHSQNICDQLKSLPLMTLEEKFQKSLPKAPMPDISLKPRSEKSAKIISEDCSSNDISLLSSDSEVITGKKKKKRNRKAQKAQNVTEMPLEITNLEYGTLGELKDRPVPTVGEICMIGYMENPSCIYIQVADDNSKLLDLWPSQLKDLYENSLPPFTSKTEAKILIGNYCCVKLDNLWYRAEVIDWAPPESPDVNVLLHMVDYGNNCMTNFLELRPLLSSFCHVPKMAQLCHLPYLYPPGSTKSIRLMEWTEEDTNGFFNICGDLDSTTFKLVHVYKCKNRNSIEIDLVKSNESEEVSLGQALIEEGHAVQIIDDGPEVVTNNTMITQIRSAHGIQEITPDMSNEEILDKYFEQNIDFEADNVNEAVMHYDPKDEAETCKNLRSDGTCYKGSQCKLRHTPLKHGFTADKKVIYNNAFVDAPLPAINTEVTLTISHIVDIQCFYAQVRYEDNSVAHGSINTLINEMNNKDVVEKYQKLKYPPSLNQLVIAKHWNHHWYRAQVKSVWIPETNEEVMIEVYIVDFGDTLEVPMSDLREIIPDFLNLCFQATECRLFNVRHKEGADEDEEKQYFESRYMGQTFRAKIVAVPGHLEVLLKNNKDEDIGLKLIEDGYGELNTEHYFPADNEVILID